MKAKLTRVEGRVRLVLDSKTDEQRQLLRRFAEMLNDNRVVLGRDDEALFDTPLRVESVGFDVDDKGVRFVDSVAIESAFQWPFRSAPRK